MNNIELLAPAGDKEALRVAINNGANAVYLGLQNFNARIRADNFTEQNIASIVEYAHLHGVKVYMTVNTLVNNSEVPSLIDTVKSAVLAGVDAYLVQDFGVAKILKTCFPGINLHASTQMGVHNLYGAKMAERLGITRVVLSREVKIQDIIDIRKNTNLEIEYFVQGALCVAFSGNCYMSAFNSGDSGNRGMCKQLCRMRYTADDQSHYYLSPSDLCLIDNLRSLIDAGVTSFKIEGRLRRPGYVGQAVQSYRRCLDHIIHNQPFDRDAEVYSLRKVFSRGDFNYNAYLTPGVPDKIINYNTQNHLGIPIGKVCSVTPFKDLSKVVIQSSQELHTGDGLKMVDNGTQIVSLGVGNVDNLGNNQYAIYTKHKLKPGYSVYLILDAQAEQVNIDRVTPIPLQFHVVARAGCPLSCTVTAQSTTIQFVTQNVLEAPRTAPTTKDEIIQQFSKLGDTDFVATEITVDTDNVFIPKSILNNARREAVANLTNEILKQAFPTAYVQQNAIDDILNTVHKANETKQRQCIIILDENNDIQPQSISDILCLEPTVYDEKIVKNWVKTHKNHKIALFLPIVANYLDLKILDKIIYDNPELTLVANNIYALEYIYKDRKVIAGTGLNVFNNFSRDYLLQLGVQSCVISVEQSLDKIIVDSNDYVYSLGLFPLMTLCHCPHKAVRTSTCKDCQYKNFSYTNEQGASYPIRRYKISQCYFELLNPQPIFNMQHHAYNAYIDTRGLNITHLNNINLPNSILGKSKSSVK